MIMVVDKEHPFSLFNEQSRGICLVLKNTVQQILADNIVLHILHEQSCQKSNIVPAMLSEHSRLFVCQVVVVKVNAYNAEPAYT